MDDATAAGDGAASSALLSKILAMAFLGVSSFVAGSTPVCVFERLGIRRRARGAANAVLRSILNFGGGVLLCTTFLHLLPEVREGVGRLTAARTIDPASPVAGLLAELVMCVGFFFMYTVEELVHGFAGAGCHAHGDQQHQHHGDPGGGAATAAGNEHGNGVQRGRGQNGRARVDDADAGPPNVRSAEREEAAAGGRIVNYNSCSSAATVEMAAVNDPTKSKRSPADRVSVLRGFLVIGALSIHELFEGLAVGLEKNPKQVWSLTVAVACHKLVIAFYVGLQMLSDRTKPLLAHCSILLFAITSPTGIGIGALVSNLRETNTVVVFSVVLQGLATGTLMYVVFFEVLKPSEGHLQVKQRILRLVFIAIGFASMLSIQMIISEE